MDREFDAKVAEARQAHPRLVVGMERDRKVIALVDREPADDDPGDVVCVHAYSEDGLSAAVACAEADGG